MTAEPTDPALLLDNDNPWPGLHEFNEFGRKYFNGRDEEQAALFRLVRDSRTVVLYGRSGFGKTSLLQAGLFPRLRQENYLPVPIRFIFQDQNTPLIHQAKDAFLAQLKLQRVDHPAFESSRDRVAILTTL